MAQAMRPNTAGGLFATDGRPHPLQDALLAVTLVLGITSFVTAMFHSLHLLSSWTGLVGILTGAYGLGASAVGFFLGMAHGGLFGGVF